MPAHAPAHPTVRFLDDEGQTRTGELTLWRRLDDGAWWADVTVDNGGRAVTVVVPAERLQPVEGQDYRAVMVWRCPATKPAQP